MVETRHLTIERQARYAMLGDPRDEVTQVWFVLHGYGQLAPFFLRHFRDLADGTRMVVAPEGLHRHYLERDTKKVGASWMTAEDRLTDISDYVAYLDRLYALVFESLERERVRVVGLGFSQGVHTLCRWIAFGRATIERAILWGSTVPPDLDLDAHRHRLGEAGLVLVVGDEDRYFTPEAVRAHHDRLEAHGVPFAAVPYAGGHALDGELLRTLADEVT